MNITPEQALNNLDEVAKTVNANRETHLILAESVRVLRALIDASTTPEQ